MLLAGWLICPNPAAAQSPTIIAGPTNQVVAVGGTVTLGVTAGGPAPAYQWFKDSRLLLGATNSMLTVANAGVTNSGMYYVVVTNGSGMVISLPASVAVGNPSLLAWGFNNYGQLGNGTTSNTNRPISVATNVVVGAAGANHSLFVTTDGTLWVMGLNSYGQLGNGTKSSTNLPISVASNVVVGAAGANHSLFVTTDGTLWVMGLNSYGQLGNGTKSSTNLPISVASNVVAVAAGTNHSLFVTTDGTLWAMGLNTVGQLGNGTTTDAHTPISVASNVVAVAAGMNHSLFVKTDGTLWVMGLNSYGQLGNGTTTDAHTPISVGSNVVAVTAGQNHSLFVKNDGRLWAMGNNSQGQLGNGTTSSTNLPVIVPILWVANIFPADMASHTLALANNNAIVILGNLGQFYTGGTISVSVSTSPPGLTVNLTYNGSPFAPTNVGSYTVIGTVSDPICYGSATNTLVIMPVGSITVGSDATLRTAMSLGGKFTLAFDGTLSLSNEITVTLDTTLDASGHNVVLSGRGSNRLFRINAGKTLTLINLTLQDGLAAGTNGVSSSDNGGDGAGGAILNQGGTLNAINCSFLSNTAQGGQGGPYGKGGNAFGGAVFNQTGWVGLTNSVLGNNIAAGGPGGFSFGEPSILMGELWSETIVPFRPNSSAGGNGASGYKRNDLGGDASGGAIFNTNGSLNLILTVLSGNTSTGGYMGGRAAGAPFITTPGLSRR